MEKCQKSRIICKKICEGFFIPLKAISDFSPPLPWKWGGGSNYGNAKMSNKLSIHNNRSAPHSFLRETEEKKRFDIMADDKELPPREEVEDLNTKKFYVIGAGLPRTGTMSLMYALEILLPGKCYHG